MIANATMICAALLILFAKLMGVPPEIGVPGSFAAALAVFNDPRLRV